MNPGNHSNASESRRPRRRLPSVNDAIPYSPFTSIVPFDSENIPVPLASPPHSLISSLSMEEKKTVTKTIKSLDKEASQPPKTRSRTLDDTLKGLQRLLNPSDLTRYELRIPPHLQQQTNGGGSSTEVSPQKPNRHESRLGSFANLLLDSTNVEYSYPSPTSLDPSPQKNRRNLENLQEQKLRTVTFEDVPSQNLQAFNFNSSLTNLDFDSTKATTEVYGATDGPSIIIPQRIPSSHLETYQSYPDLDASIIREDLDQGHKRKRDQLEAEDEEMDIDQRQRAAKAVQDLQEFMSGVFEAEDQLEPDFSGQTTGDYGGYFISEFTEEGPTNLLQSKIQLKFDTAIQSVVNTNGFADVNTEDLLRMQKLCARSVSLVQDDDLKPPGSDDEDSLSRWDSNLNNAESSLIASKILIRIAIAAEKNTHLRSEEILHALLKNFKIILEGCIIPIVELRLLSAPEYLKASGDRKALLSKLVQRSGRVLQLIGKLLMKVDLSEDTITTVEFISTKLLFVENSTSERESILGVNKFEIIRRYAMDVVARVFLRRPEQRSFILEEILSSLEKLPTNRQGSKHYRTNDGKMIRVVSALIMQLIQTSTIQTTQSTAAEVDDDIGAQPNEDDSEYEEEGSDSEDDYTRKRKSAKKKSSQHRSEIPTLKDFADFVDPLFESAQKSANYVVFHLVTRALATTKTGDEPYRQLLDDFTEDFISVLGYPDWPAAELLLRVLLLRLINVVEDTKSLAPARNLALELMGRMGSAIAEIQTYLGRTSQTFAEMHQPFVKNIIELCDDTQEDKVFTPDLLKQTGPYRVVIEHLQSSQPNELSAQSARHYCLVQWAKSVVVANDGLFASNGEDSNSSNNLSTAAEWLTSQIQETQNAETLDQPIENAEARLCFALVLLNLPFCRALSRIMGIFMTAVSSHHATVRSRALKSVVQVLKKDPGMLKRSSYVLSHILRAASDASSLVRESSLGIIAECIELMPELEAEVLDTIMAKTGDPGTQVRKRSMKLLKDIYVRSDIENKVENKRPAIASAILQRLSDMEESVIELARQTIEEIWIVPFQDISAKKELSAKRKQEVQQHVCLLVATAQRGEAVVSVLEQLFRDALSIKHKNSSANKDMCKVLVSIMFDMIIDNDAAAGKPTQSEVLHTLTIFAKAYPNLFDSEQMSTLRPYIENLSNSEDVIVYRSVIVIYRCVLPVLPPLQHTFLRGVQDILFTSISKLGKRELDEVSTCLWIIDGVLENTGRLANLVVSTIKGIERESKANSQGRPEENGLKRLEKYLMIAGYLGKAFDLEAYKDAFKEKIPNWRVHTISGLIVDVVCQFTDSKYPGSVRERALESVGLVCRSWPKNFLKSEVNTAFESVFREQTESLELVILSAFKAFYLSEEERFKGNTQNALENGDANGENKLAKSMIQSDNDGASASIAQQYLQQILRISLQANNELAVVATELVASINRQGLVHPKECGPAIIALETSPNPIISKMAFESHKDLHQKYESMLEKEYIRAIDRAFAYQRDVFRNVSGVDSEGVPKLRQFFEVLKTSSSIVHRKKLLGNLCSKMNIDPAKLGQRDLSTHLEYARFVVENLSLFEYGRVDDLVHLTGCLEKAFKNTGNTISQKIESLLNLNLEPIGDKLSNGHPDQSRQELHQLTLASIILSMLWELRTYLRRTWNIPQAREAKQKLAIKDLNKAPVKSSVAAPEKHLEKIAGFMNSLADDETMKEQCRAFVELVSVDQELTVDGTDQEDDSTMRFSTPSEDGHTDGTPVPASGGSKGSKRKGIHSVGSTPKKPKGIPRTPSAGRRKSSINQRWDADDDGGWD